MASFVYDVCKQKLLDGTLGTWVTDLRCLLVMASTTADTEKDKTTVGGFTTLGEFNGSSSGASAYPAVGNAGIALTGEAVTSLGSNKFCGDATDITFSGLSGGSAIQAIVVIKFVTNHASSIPLVYIDDFTTFTPNGGDFVVTWSANGILLLQDA